MSEEQIINILLIILLILIILTFIVCNFSISHKEGFEANKGECSNYSIYYNEYPTIANLQEIDMIDKKSTEKTTDTVYFKLRDYYIKSAFNCAIVDKYNDGVADNCALINCIRQGARCLDFELYFVDDNAVVSSIFNNNENSRNTLIKGSSVDMLFSDALKIIDRNAFNSPAPNPKDPLIIHLRIKIKNNPSGYKKIYNDIMNNISLNKLLPTDKYGNEFDGESIGNIPINKLMGKLIIAVSPVYKPLYESSILKKITNISTSHPSFRVYLPDQFKNELSDQNAIIDYNKHNLSFVIPNLTHENEESSVLAEKSGAQMIAMSFSTYNENLKYYHSFFSDSGRAFVLKPPTLRYIPEFYKKSKNQDKNVNYAEKNTTGGSGQLKIPITM